MLLDFSASIKGVSPIESALRNSGISRTGINIFFFGSSRNSSNYFSLYELAFLKNAVGVGSEYLSKTDVYFLRSEGPIFFCTSGSIIVSASV